MEVISFSVERDGAAWAEAAAQVTDPIGATELKHLSPARVVLREKKYLKEFHSYKMKGKQKTEIEMYRTDGTFQNG